MNDGFNRLAELVKDEEMTWEEVARFYCRKMAEVEAELTELKAGQAQFTFYNVDQDNEFLRRPGDDYFPYYDKCVPFIVVNDRRIEVAKSVNAKRRLLLRVPDVVLAVWPGQWSSDVFVLERDKAIGALGY
ncbi:hypothetical protein KC887_07975 [Candidatus Kaiserbacteria bacterium]|nr:hypothetical protein [Candidatus Kaiserbacteria bacterium]